MAKLGLFLMVVVANIVDIIPEDTIEIAPISGKDLLAKLQAKIAPVSGDGTSAEGDDYAFSIRPPKRPSRPVGSSKKDVLCDKGWKRFELSCYKLVSGYNDIRVCRADCQKEGSDLASIHNQEMETSESHGTFKIPKLKKVNKFKAMEGEHA